MKTPTFYYYIANLNVKFFIENYIYLKIDHLSFKFFIIMKKVSLIIIKSVESESLFYYYIANLNVFLTKKSIYFLPKKFTRALTLINI